ncbi:VOC family protein [Bacillus sp. FJAT-44742]|uniref:VOC family protein n=1 Tax=Bacillus sp. FJAT-44742 TaxID=2014005 RepID=UPI000C2321DF|nr:VOC family protein [Bacillus sp. FJAT-44742]
MTMRLNPYLVMDGTGKEAIEFYEHALGAKVIGVQTFGEMPESPEFSLPEEAKDRIAHGLLKVGETDLMLSDTFPGQPHQAGNQVTICIVLSDKKRTNEVFEALSADGKVTMPLQETFWSPAYGIVTDKFGVTFQITTE